MTLNHDTSSGEPGACNATIHECSMWHELLADALRRSVASLTQELICQAWRRNDMHIAQSHYTVDTRGRSCSWCRALRAVATLAPTAHGL